MLWLRNPTIQAKYENIAALEPNHDGVNSNQQNHSLSRSLVVTFSISFSHFTLTPVQPRTRSLIDDAYLLPRD